MTEFQMRPGEISHDVGARRLRMLADGVLEHVRREEPEPDQYNRGQITC